MTKAIVVGAAEIQLRAPVDKVTADLKKAKVEATKSADDAAKAWDAGMKKIDGAVEKTGAKVARTAKKKTQDEKVSADASAKSWADGMRRIEEAVSRVEKATSLGFKSVRAQAAAEAKATADAWADAMKRIEGGFDRMAAAQRRTSGRGPVVPGSSAPGSSMPSDDGGGLSVVGLGSRLLPALGAAAAAKIAADLSDAWTSAGNKLSALGTPLAEVNSELNEMVEIANRSRSEFSATVGLYSRMSRAASDLGITQDQAKRATETVQKALAMQGATTAEAASATMQLGQALGAGILRGDEFNSIMENAPIIAQAIAREFGVSTTALRKMAETGELTSKRVMKALLDMSDGVDTAFSNTNATISQSFSMLMNSLTQAAGRAGEASGVVKLVNATFDVFRWTIEGLNWAIDEFDGTNLRRHLEDMRRDAENAVPWFERVRQSIENIEKARARWQAANIIAGGQAGLGGLGYGNERVTAEQLASGARTGGLLNLGGLGVGTTNAIDPFRLRAPSISTPAIVLPAAAEVEVDRGVSGVGRLEDAFVRAAEKLATLKENWRETLGSITADAVTRQADSAVTQLGRTIEADNRTIEERAAAKEDMKLSIQEALWQAASTGDWKGMLEMGAQEALKNAFMRATDFLADLLADIFMDIDFAGTGSSSGGGFAGLIGDIVGSLFGGGGGGGQSGVRAPSGGGQFGYELGGYTGGKRGKPAGIVHGEEFVFDADATADLGVGNLTALQNGFNPWQPTEMTTGPDSGSRVANSVMNVSIDATGADAAALRRVEAQIQELNRTFTSRVVTTAYEAQQRGFLAG